MDSFWAILHFPEQRYLFDKIGPCIKTYPLTLKISILDPVWLNRTQYWIIQASVMLNTYWISYYFTKHYRKPWRRYSFLQDSIHFKKVKLKKKGPSRMPAIFNKSMYILVMYILINNALNSVPELLWGGCVVD